MSETEIDEQARYIAESFGVSAFKSSRNHEVCSRKTSQT